MVLALTLLPAHTAAEQRTTPIASAGTLRPSGAAPQGTMRIVVADTGYPVPAVVVVDPQRADDDITAATVTIVADGQRRPTSTAGLMR